MNRLLFFFLCMLIITGGSAQSNYAEAIKQGDDAFNRKEYKIAINKYFAAEAFDPSKKDEAKEKVNKVFDKIEALRTDADKQKKES